MDKSGLIKVAGHEYQWWVELSKEFSQLWTGITWNNELEILRIESLQLGFDIAIRIDSAKLQDSVHRWLGPVLVLGEAVPTEIKPCTKNILIMLRPKLSILNGEEPDATTAERVVQWMVSGRFRAHRINSSGGHWVGYGYPT